MSELYPPKRYIQFVIPGLGNITLYGKGRDPVKDLVCVCVLSHVWLFAAPWTVAHQAPLSMELSRQEYWNGLQLPIQGILPI